MGKDRPANRFGRCFSHRKEAFALKDLKPADHMVEESMNGLGITYWHHMIVESVDVDEKIINVIHFSKDSMLELASVHRTERKFMPKKFYRIVYEEGEFRASEEVLERAEGRLGGKFYCPCFNDCECFAHYCKIEEAIPHPPHQIWTAIEIFAKSAISTVVYGAKYSVRLNIVVSMVVELLLFSKDVYVAITKWEEGKITREEFCEVLARRICAAICSFPGFWAGFFLGARIIQRIIKKVLLVLLGQFLGGAVGDFLSKEAGGEYLGSLFAPIVDEYFCKKYV